MKIEEQVVSFELAKKLKELGIKQDSLFYWIDEFTASPYLEYLPNYGFSQRLSAFMLTELMEILPNKYKLLKDGGVYYCVDDHCLRCDGHNSYYYNEVKSVDAAAKMLIYLIENKLIEIKNESSRTL